MTMRGSEVVAPVRRFALPVVGVGVWLLVVITHGCAVISGWSMWPTLTPGDILVYRRSAEGVRIGDLVLFEHREWPGGVVHRVCAETEDGSLVLRGDANEVPDRDPVRTSQVRGVGVAYLPTGRAARVVAGALQRCGILAHQSHTER